MGKNKSIRIGQNENRSIKVDSMRKQNMLKDEKIAELLKDNPDER